MPPADPHFEGESNAEKFLRHYAACSREGLQEFIGQPATQTKIEAVRARSGATSMRIVPAGEPIPMDAQTGRLTVELDRDGTMLRVTCV